MFESKPRRHLAAEEKLRILEEAQRPGVQVAELRRRHGIGTSQFYHLAGAGSAGAKQALSQPAGRNGPGKIDAAVARLTAERIASERWSLRSRRRTWTSERMAEAGRVEPDLGGGQSRGPGPRQR